MENQTKKKSRKRSKNLLHSYIDRLCKEIYFFEERGEYEEAIRRYDRILEFYPKDQNALLWKNQLINLQGKKGQMYS